MKTAVGDFRILLVDDSASNRILIGRYLERASVPVDLAEDGEIGLRLFQTRRYGAVLLDIEMPVLDGYQVIVEIRRIEEMNGVSSTPVLALTAHNVAEIEEAVLGAGFTGILTKPISQATLLEALAQYGGLQCDASIPRASAESEADIIPGYLAKRRADVAIYEEKLAIADFDAIRNLAHKMKGTGTGYGFPRLTGFGAALEKSALEANTSAIRDSLDEFASYLDSIDSIEPES